MWNTSKECGSRDSWDISGGDTRSPSTRAASFRLLAHCDARFHVNLMHDRAAFGLW